MSDEQDAGWSDFFQKTKISTPHNTVLKAIEQFAQEPTSKPRYAIDLGCGMGRDTFELLRNGWRVLAMDKEQEPLDWINSQKPPGDDFLSTRQMSFENLDLSNLDPDLINASYSLPFCPKDKFDTVWESITKALKPGARFSGHFFGENDPWAQEPLKENGFSTNHHSLQEVQEILKDFEIEHFQEEDGLGGTATGQEKHWHIFHIVAKKK